ncbi:hypothetical protein [Granulicella sibirica]|uniref:hypothetical protein n=1 Tax=Granulicella sibirica TaxID=2479048 RepID=UPI0010086A2E|nr:hypothetical protein [Granulicella sibirica]
MKRWPWQKIASALAVSLILVGLVPLAYLGWWGSAHNLEPLSLPLPLRRGTYTSPRFRTDLDEDYQIEIYFVPFNRSPLILDWKTIDESGALIQSGSYKEDQRTGGNDVILERRYRPKRGSSQRIIVTIAQDVQAPDANTKLHIGLPERSLAQGYGFAAAATWAVVVAGAGAILFFVLSLMRVGRRQTP